MAAEAIEKLGDSKAGPGYQLLGLLSQCGWYVAVTHAFAGDGILVVAEHPKLGKVSKSGSCVAEIACDLAEACLALSAEGRLGCIEHDRTRKKRARASSSRDSSLDVPSPPGRPAGAASGRLRA